MSVLKLEDILNKKEDENQDVNASSSDGEIESNKNVKGRPKSGRIWKEPKKRASSIVKTRGIRLTKNLDKRRAIKLEIEKNKRLSREIKEERQQKRLEKKQRTEENLKRREENRKKAEIVQIITNTAKLKKMKRKHLRSIEKRDTNDMKSK